LLLYLEDAYVSVLDRPGRTFWRELERILREDGALEGGQLDAASVLRAMEPYGSGGRTRTGEFLPHSPIIRLRGAFVGLEVQASHLHFINRVEQRAFTQQSVNDTLQPAYTVSESRRSDLADDVIRFGPRAEFHRPIGLKWQVDGQGELLFPTRDPAHGLRLNSSGSVSVLVADRWLASASFNQFRVVGEKAPFTKTLIGGSWAVDYGATLSWYVEDRLRLDLKASGQQTGHIGFGPTFERFEGISLGLSYKIAGGIDAPGLIEPVRIRP